MWNPLNKQQKFETSFIPSMALLVETEWLVSDT